jgi:dynein heavy chain
VDWQDDLKVLMKKVGGEGKSALFLFSDTEIKDESFIEDIIMIMNTGEVPNIFAPAEKTEISEVMQTAVRVLVSI